MRAPIWGKILEVEATARDKGLMLGTIEGAGRSYADLRDAGYNFIVGPNDISLLAGAARKARKDATELLA